MSQALIRQAFETRLKTWADAQGLGVAWENMVYTPTEGEEYVHAFLLPARTKSLFLDGSGRNYVGLFQVNLSMPLGGGAGTAEAMVKSLDEAFATSFTQGTIRVSLLSPMSAASALPVPDRYVVPVSAEYCVVTV
jgi:hypothetical protein